MQTIHTYPSQNLYNSTCLAPSEALVQMMSGFRVTQLIYVAAELSIADLVQDAPKSVDELAYLIEVDREALYRVMQGLASIGIFTHHEDGCFAPTPYSYYLRADVPDSLRPRILFWGQEWNQLAWSHTLQTVKTGESGFNVAFGLGFFESLIQHPTVAQRFDEHIASRTAAFAQAVVTAYDFSHFDNIVGVGAGYGALIVPILQANPHLSGIVFDLPSVSKAARQYIQTAGLTGRCTVISGNYFTSVPVGADLYILSEVIHSYDDDDALAILRNCRQAMAPQGKILLIEKVMAPCNATSFDLAMQHITLLLETGGRERTADEYAALLQAAGFSLTKIIPTDSQLSIIEGAPTHSFALNSFEEPHSSIATKKVAVVIPALNEEDALSHLLAELPSDIAEWIIVVDNGSTDATAAVARSAGAIVASEPTPGYGRACLKGLKTASSLGADIVVFMDGDGSDDPADLPRMLAPILEGRADLVIGSRVTRRSERGAILLQARLGNWLVSRLIRLLYGVHLHDIGSFRIIPCSLLEVLNMSEMTFGWPVEMLVKAARAHYRIVELPIHYRHRTHGRSKVAGTLSGSIKAAYAMLRTTLYYTLRPDLSPRAHRRSDPSVGRDLSPPSPIYRPVPVNDSTIPDDPIYWPIAHQHLKRRTHV